PVVPFGIGPAPAPRGPSGPGLKPGRWRQAGAGGDGVEDSESGARRTKSTAPGEIAGSLGESDRLTTASRGGFEGEGPRGGGAGVGGWGGGGGGRGGRLVRRLGGPGGGQSARGGRMGTRAQALDELPEGIGRDPAHPLLGQSQPAADL